MAIRCEIIDPTGVRKAPFGHMLTGEVRIFEGEEHEAFARKAIANGWMRHVPYEGEEKIPDCDPSQRGKLDGPAKTIQPDAGRLGVVSR